MKLTYLFDTSLVISLVVGALYELSLRLQKHLLTTIYSRSNKFLLLFSLISISRMVLLGIFVYNLLHMNYLKGIINGTICVITLFLLRQKKA